MIKLSPFLLSIFFFLSCNNKPKQEPDSAPTPQNILFIISDDLATHAVGCYGNELVKTPNIDRLAASGVRFASAFATAPMCTPSRASLITGRYPYAAGVTLLHTPLADSILTIPEYLKTKGYATGSFGKHHFNSGLKHGYDTLVNNREHRQYLASLEVDQNAKEVPVRPQWKPFRDPANIWLNADGATSGNDYEHSQGTYFAKEAIKFITAHRDQPFFAVASFREPHSPFNFPTEFYERHAETPINLPTASAEDARWVPAVFKDLTDAEKQGITRSYYTSVEYMDRNVGLLLDALEELKLRDNTLVVFVGDHGYLLQHHGRFEKHMMWREAVQTPLIISGMGLRGTVEQNVSLISIAPTFLDALGMEAMPQMQGESLLPLARGTTVEAPDPYIFSVYLEDEKAMIFDGRYKYVYTTGSKDLQSGYATGFGPSGVLERLYDLEKDPTESTNVIDKHPDKTNKLRTWMVQKFRATHPRANEVSAELPELEQLQRFCTPVERFSNEQNG